ncbi:hypothetical protein BDQ12DRAFT_620089 [Crucibulum laeve]|uniref:BRCT domain-containing protein n=1 Tax=Crucibulum laeve TaxID=68775 RepID=A0A5C3MFR3_9AGAR|nr:hypothetical protein BDQ12DRAFT_620089 [Crucibulum laeve]
MLGGPLQMYVEKDVEDKDEITRLITKHGGQTSHGYSGVPYILVDPHKESGQNLWRQYAGKRGKLILDARWVHECIRQNQLQTVFQDWAGCKVTGKELVYAPPPDVTRLPSNAAHTLHPQPIPPPMNHTAPAPPPQHQQHPSQHSPQHPQHPGHPYPPYPVYTMAVAGPNGLDPAAAPPQTWHTANGIPPQQPHLGPGQPAAPANSQMMQRPYREDAWEGYHHQPPHDGMEHPPPQGYDYRYREEQGWPAHYYDPAPYDQGYGQPTQYMEDPSAAQATPTPESSAVPAAASTSNAVAGPSNSVDTSERPTRGRKRTRNQPQPAPPAATLVTNRAPPAKSPTPPSRIIKSTYGGNLFTADDIEYLKKYIDYCQEQGMVLSLREICERIAIKAPHHTFYSWRRYCNKHQIRLGGYLMNGDRSPSPEGNQDTDMEDELERELRSGLADMDEPAPVPIPQPPPVMGNSVVPGGRRSPTPPRALYRSTTGKGVAFTEEDVRFLVRFLEYRKSTSPQGKVDMVTFWKDVASKAPHHSRASWMKFWRRHKHELERTEGDEPLPLPPDKKMRYSSGDDILLAKYFFNKPTGTSDKIFQAFARQYPHHPWKGWQEHHRIHKAKIDHLIILLGRGESIDE